MGSLLSTEEEVEDQTTETEITKEIDRKEDIQKQNFMEEKQKGSSEYAAYAASPEGPEVESQSEEIDAERKPKRVGYFEILFFNADRIDIGLIVLGAVAAIGTGAALPLTTLFLGDTLNAYNFNPPTNYVPGSPIPDGFDVQGSGDILDEVGKQSMNLFYVSLGGLAAGSINMYCWMYVGTYLSVTLSDSWLSSSDFVNAVLLNFSRQNFYPDICYLTGGSTLRLKHLGCYSLLWV